MNSNSICFIQSQDLGLLQDSNFDRTGESLSRHISKRTLTKQVRATSSVTSVFKIRSRPEKVYFRFLLLMFF